MSGIKQSIGSAKARQGRKVKVAPMTQAVRRALAASAMAFALSFGGTATAANPDRAPLARDAWQFQSPLDRIPVVDLTSIASLVTEEVPEELFSTAISEYGPGDIVIDNADPILENQTYNAVAIYAYSTGGNVDINNQATGSLQALSSYSNAIGIYGYSLDGSVDINNEGGVFARSVYGLADGIFASGTDVDVSNSGDITAVSVYGGWAAGIEAQATDLTTVYNTGSIYASAAYGAAYGIYATGADVAVGNSGNIEAQGYSATGIEAQSSGDLSITNSGDITAGSISTYYNPYTYSTYVYGSALATGINAESNGEGAAVEVGNSGDISAVSYFGGAGIAATSGGQYGTASVTNSGAIYSSQYAKYGYGAYGIVTSADGDSSIDNSGAITVVSAGVANGLTALSFAGAASVTNSGDVSVDSTAALYYAAIGITAFSANGTAHVDNSGTVAATAKYWATGVDARAYGDVAVTNSGVLSADGDKYAFGVYALSNGGDVSVHNDEAGEIGFYSYLGRGWGVFAYAGQGDVQVSNAGAISGYAYGQSAGVFAIAGAGNVSVTNSGSIEVISGSNVAVGAFARADYGTASVTNSGDITASNFSAYYTGNSAYGMFARGAYAEASNSGNITAEGYYYATGIAASSYYGTTVSNTGGNISATALGGATGISATSVLGGVDVTNASSIQAIGLAFGATGISAYAVADAHIDNSGNVYVASLYGNAIGLYAYSVYGDASIGNAGDIAAVTYYGLADGIFASGANVDVGNSGALTAVSVYGDWAAGIEAQGSESVSVENSGDITSGAGVFVQVSSYYYGTIGYSTGGTAYGIYATGGAAGVGVTNSGNIEVQGGYVTGIEVQSGGDIAVDNSGDIVAGSGLNSYGFYYGADYITVYYGTQLANGINATSNGEGAAVGVTNSGDISADGIFGATGIAATSSGTGGSASVDNSGAIYASQNQKYGYGAYGIVTSADGDSSIDNSGAIYVYSGGVANGATALSFAGDAHVTNSGDITTYSSAALGYTSTGIIAFSANGTAHVDNSGSVDASAKYWASAVTAQAQGDVTVDNSGSLYADGQKYAFGVYALSNAGDVSVHNDATGEIGFYSYLGRGWGVFAYAGQGDVQVSNAGAISGYAFGQSAGVFAVAGYGDVMVDNSGSINVISGGDVAVGAFARADYGTASVSNSGDITASNFGGYYTGDAAYGVLARGAYAEATNSGNITAEGYYYATGIAASSYYGTSVTTSVTSSIEASALLVAIGIEGRALFGDVVVSNAGDVTVEGVYGGGVGIQAYAYYGGVTAANAGDILAGSTYGTAIGVTGYAVFGDTMVSNSGTIEAAGYYGAYGIAAQAYLGDVTVVNSASGEIYAAAPSYAYGVFASAVYGDVTINNAGDISAGAAPGGIAAAVLMESAYGQSTLNNAATGTISVNGTDGYAFAVIGSDAVDTINNSGDLYGAISLLGGNDTFNNRAGGLWDVDGTVSTDFGDGNDTLGNAGSVWIVDGSAISFGDGDDTVNNLASGLIHLNSGAIEMGAGTDLFSNAGLIESFGHNTIRADTFDNHGLIDFLDGATDDLLAIQGNLAGAGNMHLDLDLTGSSDQLSIDGNVAANAVQTVSVLFQGMPTTAHTSVAFAHVTGTSAAGNFIGGQMIGYNEPANFLDLDLNVSSQLNTANTAADVFYINLDVVGLNDTGTLAANVASGAAGFLNSQVGTFRQRLGANPYGDSGSVMSAFVRAYTDDGDVSPGHVAANFGQGGNFAYNQSTWGREIGVNANLFGNFHAGLVLGNADSRQRLTGAGSGENRMDGLTWGAYATWYVPEGFYVDFTGRWMAADIRSISAAGTMVTRAHTRAMSLEGGYEWKLGSFSLVPQLQYTRTEVQDVRTIFGDRANFLSHGGTYSRGRLGVELNKTFTTASGMRWTPYGSINAIREFDGESTYTVADNFHGSTSLKGTSTMAELGIGVQKGGFGVTLGANWTDGGALDGFVGGQAVFRFAW